MNPLYISSFEEEHILLTLFTITTNRLILKQFVAYFIWHWYKQTYKSHPCSDTNVSFSQGGSAWVPTGGICCPAGYPGPCDGLLPHTGRCPLLCQVQQATLRGGYVVWERHTSIFFKAFQVLYLVGQRWLCCGKSYNFDFIAQRNVYPISDKSIYVCLFVCQLHATPRVNWRLWDHVFYS